MEFGSYKFYKKSNLIMSDKALTKWQKEARERRELKEAEFHLNCSIID